MARPRAEVRIVQKPAFAPVSPTCRVRVRRRARFRAVRLYDGPLSGVLGLRFSTYQSRLPTPAVAEYVFDLRRQFDLAFVVCPVDFRN